MLAKRQEGFAVRLVPIAMSLLAALVIAAPVSAKSKHSRARRQAAPVAAPIVNVCRPLCAADVTPCDPPEFKRADGRCDFSPYGGAGGGFR
ncbi:MAG: hypothetical protein KGM42_16695 [Hyphomicrobiales bacterium]|nr:hypothetical protein [Hyphomicrobiales bacterium]